MGDLGSVPKEENTGNPISRDGTMASEAVSSDEGERPLLTKMRFPFHVSVSFPIGGAGIVMIRSCWIGINIG